MRLFVALDIDDAIRERICRFVDGVCGFAPEVRFVRLESLHVTLKFIGERPEAAVEVIRKALASIRAGAVDIALRSYGFFPSPKAARVFWIGVDGGRELTRLAAQVDEALAAADIPKEEHGFSPHLTLARDSSRKRRGSGDAKTQKDDEPNHRFQRLQEKLGALSLPEFGTMTAGEFFLYRSQSSPQGSIYTQVARFELS